MSEKEQKGSDAGTVDNLEVEPLTDSDLESIAGGNTEEGFQVANNATTGCPVSSNTANACC